jgi:hypothetical protein
VSTETPPQPMDTTHPVWPVLDPDDNDRLPILERVLEGLRSI